MLKLYSYIDRSKNDNKTCPIVFSVETTDILSADELAKQNNINPMKFACAIGLKLVLFKRCESFLLSSEEVGKSKITGEYFRILPKYHYKNDELVIKGDSKDAIINSNKQKIKHWLYSNVGMLYWELPNGFRYLDNGFIKQNLSKDV